MEKNRWVKTRISLGVILALVLSCWIYIQDYYSADAAAEEALRSGGGITVTVTEDRAVFTPEEAQAGLIFYPGGKVEFTAYAPLMRAFADRGVLCVLVRMPWNLAILKSSAAEGIPEAYPQVERWYIGGHSLGGYAAASYAQNHAEDLEGLILLGAYSGADLSDSGLEVISVYGELDGVMNRSKYEKSRSNLPEGTLEWILPGGNHAGFGSYGPQKGDGESKVSGAEQALDTASFCTQAMLDAA